MGLLDNYNTLSESAKQYALNALARFGNGVGNTVQAIPGNAQKLAQGLLNLPQQVGQTFSDKPGGLFSTQLAQQVNQAMSRPAQANPGQWMDKGMALAGMAPVMGLLGHTVYHGSPHKFDAFDMSKIGTGEGAQAYGHGLYMAEEPAVAAEYMRTGRDPGFSYDGVKIDRSKNTVQHEAAKLIYENGGDKAAAMKAAGNYAYDNLLIPEIQKLDPSKVSIGNFYKVDIPDESIPRMLDWDAPIAQQPESVRSALLSHPALGEDVQYMVSKNPNITGREIWESAVDRFNDGGARVERSSKGAPTAASQLKELGIHGIRYLDGSSRGTGQGTSNFVLFDDQLPRILEVNGQPTGLLSWADEAAQKAKQKKTK